MISENRNPFTRTDQSGQRVIVIADASALITYRVDYTALVGGEEIDLSALATSVYVREGDQWRSVLHQQTAL
jgi:hypothetical protein